MTIANQLKNYRIKSGLSQNEVANQLNLSRQSISKWENGKNFPDLDNLILLSNLYEVSLDELLKENEEVRGRINHKQLAYTKKIIVEKDEGGILLLLASISLFFFPLGLLISVFAIWKNKKENSFYQLVYVICILSILFNLFSPLFLVI